ncbi:MAG: archease [Chloroflexota bacterium]|nr:archease [Chloroflexota bacterium]
MSKFFEELDHTADWTIRVWGGSLEQLFENAAAAMFLLQGAEPEAEARLESSVAIGAPDLEALMVAWLNELLLLSEVQDGLFTGFAVSTDQSDRGYELTGTARGVAGRGHLAHIKATTYWDLFVGCVNGRWEATITFDT